MDFAQLLPMSFINYVDNHIIDYTKEELANEDEVFEFVQEYTDNYLNEDELDEFDFDLAVEYIKYKIKK